MKKETINSRSGIVAVTRDTGFAIPFLLTGTDMYLVLAGLKFDWLLADTIGILFVTIVRMNFSPNVRASLYMMLSMLGFVVNDLLIKTLDGSLPTAQIMWIRGCFLSVLILFIVWQRGLLSRWREGFNKLIAVRAVCEGGATLLFLSALVQLPFANLAAILQALPLAVTLGAALFLGEPVGWRRWLAILVGLLGVLIIIRPGMDGFQSASILVLLSVVFAAARDLVTRRLPSNLPSLLVSGFSAVFIALLGMVISVTTGDWEPMSTRQLAILASASCFLFFGYQFVVLSMRTGEIAYVVPYRYTGLLWAILFGYLVFDEVPDFYMLLGSAVVVSMGLYTLYRELVVSRRNKIASR